MSEIRSIFISPIVGNVTTWDLWFGLSRFDHPLDSGMPRKFECIFAFQFSARPAFCALNLLSGVGLKPSIFARDM
jgi:hypothetical protein